MEVDSLWFNAQYAIERAPLLWRLKNLSGKILKPSIQIDFENQHYHVKTVNCPDELAQVLKLRFEVFFQEFSSRKISFSLFPYDVDIYDFSCDHLIVKDKAQGKVIACYRLLSSKFLNGGKFYSESEFSFNQLLELPGNKLELGRACVHKDYRRGAVIGLLWKGLLEYARKSQTRYMFGCSSVNRQDFSYLPEIMSYLEAQDAFIKNINVTVTDPYKMNVSVEKSSHELAGNPLNSLMHMYLMAGAKMGKEVAYDEEMDCIDIFTLMDINSLLPSFIRRYS
jgi:putative hemolysin